MAEACYNLSPMKLISDCIGYIFQNIVHPHEKFLLAEKPPYLILHNARQFFMRTDSTQTNNPFNPTPTVRRHSLSTELGVIITALDGGALPLPLKRLCRNGKQRGRGSQVPKF
jgi:hypothetical protein